MNSHGDMLVRIEFTSFCLYDTLCQVLGQGGTSDPMVFFTISANGYYYASSRFQAFKSQTVDPNLVYYVDVWDYNSTMTFEIQAWADNVDLGMGDIQMDVGSSGTNGWSIINAYQIADLRDYFSGNGHSYSDPCEGRDAQMTVKFETVTMEKSRTIVLNGTDDGEGYGLYQVGNEYRYTGDDQLYVLYLNCLQCVRTVSFKELIPSCSKRDRSPL